jgi:surface antigen
MAIISSNKSLSRTEALDNAKYITEYFLDLGWTLNAVCGMLGNMERESWINPGVWQNFDEGNMSMGFGLVQWTPATNLIDWATDQGLSWRSISTQCKRIKYEYDNGLQYISTTSYPLSFSQFAVSEQSASYLAEVFCANYERAGVGAIDERRNNATYWYQTLYDIYREYHPRLKEVDEYWGPIRGTKYYYTDNVFYLTDPDIGMPNCTCYAWGRRYELTNNRPDGGSGEGHGKKLCTSDAGEWYDYNINLGDKGYPYGQTPKLGAIICWERPGAAGHVAVVEEIDENGDIVTSNSGYRSSTYFWTEEITKSSGYARYGYIFKGFIYLDTEFGPIEREPRIISITANSTRKITIQGISNSTSGEEVSIYIKWNSLDVSTSDYDVLVKTSDQAFTIPVEKPRRAKSVAVIPVRGNTMGAVYTATGLITSIPCINIYINKKCYQTIPYVFTKGGWEETLPVLRTNNSWEEIWNIER